MWFETHAHLCDPKFDNDRDIVVDRSFQAGLSTIVEIADGPAEWPKAQTLAEKNKGRVYWAAGLHPYYADQSTPALWQELEKLTHHPQFVAIGEIGLDYAKCPIPPSVQQQAFRSGIEIALKTKKPMIVHCRDAYADLLPILREYFPSRSTHPGVVHCFSGDATHAKELIQMNFYLGVDGPVTYPSAKNLRDALVTVPLDNLVLETDSPYLPPQSHRGQRNDPTHIPTIGTCLAGVFNISPEKVAAITTQNAHRLFLIK